MQFSKSIELIHSPPDFIRSLDLCVRYTKKKEIFNLGTGIAASFNDVAKEIISNHVEVDEKVFKDIVEYINFPENLKGRYQSYTLANMNAIRSFGFEKKFFNIKEGISRYIEKLKAKPE